MARREEIMARIIDSLRIKDPEWDISQGTPEYDMIAAFAAELESVTYDSVLNDYHFDLEKKVGLELDAFVGMFGFSRIAAKRGTGVATFSRGTPADQNYGIPVGTQIYVPATGSTPARS